MLRASLQEPAADQRQNELEEWWESRVSHSSRVLVQYLPSHPAPTRGLINAFGGSCRETGVSAPRMPLALVHMLEPLSDSPRNWQDRWLQLSNDDRRDYVYNGIRRENLLLRLEQRELS